jgi:hypothetical protein
MLQKLDTATTLAITITAAFILVIFGWMFFPPKAADAGSLAVLNTLTGVLGTAFVGVVQFFFGSSKGSKDKDDTISLMATGNPPPNAVPVPPAVAPPAAGG